MAFGIMTLLNYAAWFIFVFIGVAWILILMQNRELEKKRSKGKLKSVSVIIPAYNEEKMIEKCIKSVLGLEYPKHLLEIIVVNDCSKDRTQEIAKRFENEGVRVLSNKTNKGKSFSLNAGIKASKSELIACIDADSLIDSQALKNMIGYFEDSEVGSVTPAVKILQPKKFIERIQHVEYIFNIFLRKMQALIDAVHVTPGVFSVYRKDILLEVGGFSENNLTEDMDIALKIHKAGYKIENSVKAISYTVCPQDWGELYRQRLRWYRGAFDNFAKHRKMMFNRKLGNMGVFLLPFNLISTVLIITIFVSMIWNVIATVRDVIWKLSLINFDIGVYMKEFSLTSYIIPSFSTPLMFGMFGVIIGVYLINKSFGVMGESIKGSRRSYLIYLILFPFLLTAFWTAAMIYEIARIKKKW